MWYQRLFGDTRHFALQLELDDDPHPGADPLLSRSWGRLAIWVGGRCLTQSVRGGATSQAVEWYLLPLLDWAAEHSVALFNEEPLPKPTTARVASCVDWMLASERAPWQLTEAEEDRWFQERSDYRGRHALRVGFPGAAAPNLFMRRMGHFIEFSWDNDRWSTGRADLQFVEAYGVRRVGAERVESVWLDFFAALRGECEPAARAAGVTLPSLPVATSSAWTWLLPAPLRDAIRSPLFGDLAERMSAPSGRGRLLVRHSRETLLLRDCVALPASEVASLLHLEAPKGASSAVLGGLRRLRPAPTQSPYLEGYERALDVREALGWDDASAPDLLAWLRAQQVVVEESERSDWFDGALIATRGHRPLIDLNTSSRYNRQRSPQMTLAAALGLLVMDADPSQDYGLVFTDAAHWPTAARARAFAAMLLMPEDGLRTVLAGRGGTRPLQSADVQAVMDHFGTTPIATTHHLKNLGWIDDGQRSALLQALAI